MSLPPQDRDAPPPGEGFLHRWSRLKRTGEPPAEPAPSAPEVAPAPAEPTGDALKELLDSLPTIDALQPGQSLAAFFQAGVPEPLRNAAMRRMWVIDPAIRDFASEALDYAYDYNTPGAISGFGPYRALADGVNEATKLWDAAENALRPAVSPDRSDVLSHVTPDAEPARIPAPVSAAPHKEGAVLPSALRAPTGEGRATPGKSGETVADDDSATQRNEAPAPVEIASARPAIRRHGGALPQ